MNEIKTDFNIIIKYDKLLLTNGKGNFRLIRTLNEYIKMYRISDILINRHCICFVRPDSGSNPGPFALKTTAFHIELTCQSYSNNISIHNIILYQTRY